MKEFKPVLWVLGKFLGTYLLLTVMYSLYLKNYLETQMIADPFTDWVANSTKNLMHFFGFSSAQTFQVEGEPYVRFYLDDVFASIINEGCNALSVIILFVAFVIAFGQKVVPTILYTVVGVIILHISNLLRIAGLNYVIVYHYDYHKQAHDYLFPAVIYGMVVALWFVWIHFFVLKKKKNEVA